MPQFNSLLLRKSGPRLPKDAPRCPQDAPRRPKNLQDATKMLPRRPKTLQDAPKTPPRWPQDAPRRPQDAPKMAPWGHLGAISAILSHQTFQDAPMRLLVPSCTESGSVAGSGAQPLLDIITIIINVSAIPTIINITMLSSFHGCCQPPR